MPKSWCSDLPIDIRSISIRRDNKETIGKEFFAIDFETTGLDPYADRIVEVGIAHFHDGKVIDTFSSLVHSEKKISPEASAISGITDSMIADAPSEKDVAFQMAAFLGDALDDGPCLVAHNAKFDMKFLAYLFGRYRIPAHVRSLDTYRNALFLQDVPNYRLSTLAQRFGIVNENAHRALDDALTCGRLLLKLLEVRTFR